MQLGEGGARLGQEGTLQGVWHHGAGQEVGVRTGAVSSGVLTGNNFPPHCLPWPEEKGIWSSILIFNTLIFQY